MQGSGFACLGVAVCCCYSTTGDAAVHCADDPTPTLLTQPSYNNHRRSTHPSAACREQLIGLTDVTKSHFEKLVNEFEKGLEEALKEYDGGWPRV